ncbi:DUF6599 family protein [Labilibacter marinus]|uniref:DUF6599 family protein n=1 Tax=Labilibacter marinus TaxID=1477105 RepID=UPI0009500F36|nr:DUF6599 family protein [Labilibacter marinus]
MLKHKWLLLLILIGTTLTHAQVKFPELDKWEKAKQTDSYTTETLWEYINGAAASYIKYGFQKMEIIEYTSGSDYISLEVYLHESPITAFGMYAFERPSTTNYIKQGVEGYLEPSALNFWVDEYYVKISANNEKHQKAMQNLANNFIARNKLMIIQPDFLKAFPSENRVQHSEKYFPKNYLGHQFLNSVLEVSYKNDDAKLNLFTIECEDHQAAKATIELYQDFANNKELIEPGKVLIIEDMFNGKVSLSNVDNILVGCYNFSNDTIGIEYTQKLMKELQ